MQLVIGCLGNRFTGGRDIRRDALAGKVVYLGRRSYSWSVRHVPLCMLSLLLSPQQAQLSPKGQGHECGYRLLMAVGHLVFVGCFPEVFFGYTPLVRTSRRPKERLF
jgi:hypothetical protein